MTRENLRFKIVERLQNEDGLVIGTDIGPLSNDLVELAIEHFRTIHSKALACHCECLGMNAENCAAACIDAIPPYDSLHYFQVMQKWELINEKGEIII